MQPDSHQRMIEASKISPNLSIKSCRLVESFICIRWNEEENLETKIPLEYLIKNYPHQFDERNRKMKETLINKQNKVEFLFILS